MQQAAKKTSAPVLPLKDPSLFRQQCYVDGEWVDADSGKTFAVTNPATGETLAEVADLDAADARAAIEAADRPCRPGAAGPPRSAPA